MEMIRSTPGKRAFQNHRTGGRTDITDNVNVVAKRKIPVRSARTNYPLYSTFFQQTQTQTLQNKWRNYCLHILILSVQCQQSLS
jgi:hypothetical protein